MKKSAFILIACLCLASAVVAMAADGFDIGWSVIGGGGGHVQSGALILDGTLGQTVSGEIPSGALSLCSGYWCVQPPQSVYLPLLRR